MKENKIKYVYLGNELGGYRKNGYEKYMEAEEFKNGLRKIINLSEKENVVIYAVKSFSGSATEDLWSERWKKHRRELFT